MKFRAITAGAAVLAALAASADAQTASQEDAAEANTATSPDVNLTPRRLVFGPNDRGVKEITVFNRGDKQATYNIVLTDRVMTPEGALVGSDAAPATQKDRLKSATEWVRYSPRQVTLGPHQAQTVRIQARRPSDLPPGEYRTHFSVTAVPPRDTGLDIADAASGAASTDLQIRLTPVYGIMIPIIVRNAELAADAAIADVRVLRKGEQRALQFSLSRNGARSLYGGLEAYLLGSGEPKKIAQIRGVGVYPEVDRRLITLPIMPDAPAISAGSRVRIVYTDDELKPGTVLAQAEATIP